MIWAEVPYSLCLFLHEALICIKRVLYQIHCSLYWLLLSGPNGGVGEVGVGGGEAGTAEHLESRKAEQENFDGFIRR